MRSKLAQKRVPLSGSIELTYRCNLRCQHCYVSHGHTGIPGKEELSFPEIRNVFDQIVAQDCLWLLITGGEPLMRRDFLDIYIYAKRVGLLITLFTNGTMITPKIADFLAEYRPFNLEITLYGRTQETYERVTGNPGSHARCMRGIELLMERGVPLRLKTMVMTLNKHELWDMKDFARSLDVEFRYDPLINAGANGSGKPLSLRISPEEILQFDLHDPGRVEKMKQFQDNQSKINRDERFLYVCSAGIYSFHIDPYGQLSVCIMAREPGYDLRSGTFEVGWRDFLTEVRYQAPEGEYPCAKCELLPICGQCPGWAQMEHVDQQKPVSYLCQVAHKRAEAFNLI